MRRRLWPAFNKTPLNKTLARVFGARRAKRLIAGLSFSSPEFSKVDEGEMFPTSAFDAHEEVRGFRFWRKASDKYLQLTHKPCPVCGDKDEYCSYCSLPF